MAQDIGKLLIRIQGNADQFKKTISQVEEQFTASVKKIEDEGKSLFKKITLPLIAFGALGVKAFSDFDSAMTNSLSIMKTTADQQKRMTDQALELSTKMPQSARELAESFFFLASAGKDAEQAMALLPRVAEFATAGNFSMTEATDLLTDAQSALGLSSKNAAEDMENMIRLSDALVEANMLANASVRQFAQALTADAATAGREFGQELEEIVVVLAAYADKGKKAAEAGNLYGRATRLLLKSARTNKAEFESLGIKLVDAQGNFRKLRHIVKDMEVAFKDMTKPQRVAALDLLGFQTLAQKSILPLIGTSDAMTEYALKMQLMSNTTKKVSEFQMKSFANQMKLLKEDITNVFIAIGQQLAPILGVLAKGLQSVIAGYKNLSPTIKSVIGFIVGLAAAIGPLLLAFVALRKVIFALQIGAFAAKMNTAGGAVTKWGLRLGAVALAVTLFRDHILGAAKAANRLNESLKETTNLTDQMIKSYDKGTLKAIEASNAEDDFAKKKDILNKEMKKRNNMLEARNREINKHKEKIADQNFIGDVGRNIGNFFGGGDAQGDEKARIKQHTREAQAHRDALNSIKEELKKIEEQEKKVTKAREDRTHIKVQTDKLISDLKRYTDTLGMSGFEKDIFKIKSAGATKKELAEVTKALEKYKKARKALEDKEAAQQKARRIESDKKREGEFLKQRFMDPAKKAQIEKTRITQLFDEGHIDAETYKKAVKEVEDSIKDVGRAADDTRNRLKGMTGVGFNSAEAQARIRQYRDSAGLAQKSMSKRKDMPFVPPVNPFAPQDFNALGNGGVNTGTISAGGLRAAFADVGPGKKNTELLDAIRQHLKDIAEGKSTGGTVIGVGL